MAHEELTKHELFTLRSLAEKQAWAARQKSYDAEAGSSREENLIRDEEYYSALIQKIRVMEEAR